ncbi:unnamed protein product [Brassicogethes aeneus]|uniref:DUF4485 domain-containing protein n=1 Tax=Brassicogethes aeneus TaxID=1431903 RepID=A0A9P0B1L2_BRAAE|nr:unnamed protein product [Brassicogethes aeneus]
MGTEVKLDQDFLFYLDFTSIFIQKIKEDDQKALADEWLTKLCSERCVGAERKRCRNIYLAQLLLQMQEGKLKGEFLKKPCEVDIITAMDIFQPMPEDLDEAWLEDVDLRKPAEAPPARCVGNTIVASRTLKNGQGAFAYLGLSLADCEPKWMSNEGSGDLAPMQKVLAKRKTPQERQNCVNFFDVLLQSIKNELDGEQVDENEVVDNCLESLIKDLMEKNEYAVYEAMEDKEKRNELLKLLQEKVVKTKDQVLKRTEALDSLVSRIYPNAPTTFSKKGNRFDLNQPKVCAAKNKEQPPAPMGVKLKPSVPFVPDRKKLSDQMWAQAAANAPAKKNMIKLVDVYSKEVIERFLVLLRDTKGILLERYQNRHEMIVNQMQSELSDAIVKNMMKLNETQKEYKKFQGILAMVKERFILYQKKVQEAFKPPEQDNQKQLDEMNDMLKAVAASVNNEANRGKALSDEVNTVMAQLDKYKDVLKDIISKSERANSSVEAQIQKMIEALDNNKDRLKKLKAALKKLEKSRIKERLCDDE